VHLNFYKKLILFSLTPFIHSRHLQFIIAILLLEQKSAEKNEEIFFKEENARDY
jgi:hypothetical protein